VDRRLRSCVVGAHAVTVRGSEAERARLGANAADLLVLKELIEAGKVTPVIEKTYPLSDAAEAIRHLADGHARGKLVVTVSAGGLD
jgi:NADPH:quinone reductase-like Zn-dependent oxidoreductase